MRPAVPRRPIGHVTMPARTRPSSSPVSRSSGGEGGANTPFVHRDIFAPRSPPPAPIPPPDFSAAGEGKDAAPRTPPRKESVSESIIPSAAKLERWNTNLGKYPLLGWLEAHTGIRKLYIASLFLLLALLLVFRGTGMSIITILVGFLYPLHMSLKTIENCTGLFEQITGDQRALHTEEEIKEKRAEIIGQLRTWLVYWVVYGLFSTLETLSDTALSWLPVYHPVKLMFLLWCFLPKYQGSQLVFDILVRPVLIRHESAIENGVNTAQQAAMFSVGRVGRVVRAKSIQLTQAIHKTGLDIMSGSASAPPLSELPEGERVRHRVAYIEARTPLADIHEHPPSSSASPSISARPSWGQVGSEGEQYLPADDVHQQQEGLLNNAFAAASKVAEARQRT